MKKRRQAISKCREKKFKKMKFPLDKLKKVCYNKSTIRVATNARKDGRYHDQDRNVHQDS